jgi:hypothetical protein
MLPLSLLGQRMQLDRLKRREVITLIGSAAAWPMAVRAQQPDKTRRIGVLMGWGENDPEAKAYMSGFTQGLSELGWTDGRNLRMDVRWAAGNVDRMRMFAKELVDLQPGVILASTTPVTAALRNETRTIPIVFAVVSDPVGAGFVASLARPGGNITGFINVEASLGGKWLELLKEIAPRVRRAAIMFNPDTAPGGGSYFLGSFESAAQSFRGGADHGPCSQCCRDRKRYEAAWTRSRRRPYRHVGWFHVHQSGVYHLARSPQQCACDLFRCCFTQGWRIAVIRGGHTGYISPRRFLC